MSSGAPVAIAVLDASLASGADGGSPRKACVRLPARSQELRLGAPPLGLVAAIWGIFGVAALLLRAIGRALAALGIAAMACFEGHRGFRRGFSPRVEADTGVGPHGIRWN